MTKKQNKEKNLFEKYCILVVVIVCILLVGLAVYINNPTYWCKSNTHKCILEPTEKFLVTGAVPVKYSSPEEYCQNHPIEDIPEGYCKLRLKTQVELDINNCNNNPRGDNLCECEEWFTQESIYPECLKKEVISEGLELCNIVQHSCLKSHPKTDWEKHPENYIQEIKTVFNKEWINNCCEDITINITNNIQTYLANKICFEADSNSFSQINTINVSICQATSKFINQTTYRLKNECEKGNPDWIEEMKTSCGNFKRDQWELNTSQCRYIETICREKNDFEKLMDKDCQTLLSGSVNDYVFDGLTTEDYRQAWRQKGCGDPSNCIGNPRDDKDCQCEEWKAKGLRSGYIICKRTNGSSGGREFTKISAVEYNQLLKEYENDCDDGFVVGSLIENLCSKSVPKGR